MIPYGGIISWTKASLMLGDTLKVIEDFYCFIVVLDFDVMSDITVRYTVVVSIYTQVDVGYLLHFHPSEIPQVIC